MKDIDRYLVHSSQIQTDDICWLEARRIGLTRDERFILTYFSDIESQTIIYMKEILNTKGSLDPEVTAFLTMWNYEEFFHGRALARLLTECGYTLEENRIAKVHQASQVSEKLKAIGATLFSKIFPAEFIALYMTWGAINELTTLRGYEAIIGWTQNTVLRTLCERIAKQERRHFAWYFNNAEERLKKNKRTRKIVRVLLQFAWSPVGAGVKTDEEVLRVLSLVFPGRQLDHMSEEVDTKIASLSGLQDIQLMRIWADKASRARKGNVKPSIRLDRCEAK